MPGKRVKILGEFPLPVEVIPMARSFVARQLTGLGGQPEMREDFVTDNGNVILDVRNLDLVDPVRMETKINQIPGVVTCGLFRPPPRRRRPHGHRERHRSPAESGFRSGGLPDPR